LVFLLIWRDIQVRYKQTLLCVAWVLLQPPAATLLVTVVLGNLARMPADNLALRRLRHGRPDAV